MCKAIADNSGHKMAEDTGTSTKDTKLCAQNQCS